MTKLPSLQEKELELAASYFMVKFMDFMLDNFPKEDTKENVLLVFAINKLIATEILGTMMIMMKNEDDFRDQVEEIIRKAKLEIKNFA